MYAICRAIIDGQEMIAKILKIRRRKKFNAEEARKIYESKFNTLNDVLDKLKYAAETRRNEVYIYEPLLMNEIAQLEEKGFKVDKSQSGYNLHYTISF